MHSSPHLTQAVEIFNSLVSPADVVSVESLLTTPVSQKYLSGKLDDHVFNLLLNSSSVADKARLCQPVSSPHAASLLSVVPSESLGLHMDPPVLQVAIKWWLGLDVSEGSQCTLCPGNTIDHLGHQAVTCKYGGDVVTRHNNRRKHRSPKRQRRRGLRPQCGGTERQYRYRSSLCFLGLWAW